MPDLLDAHHGEALKGGLHFVVALFAGMFAGYNGAAYFARPADERDLRLLVQAGIYVGIVVMEGRHTYGHWSECGRQE